MPITVFRRLSRRQCISALVSAASCGYATTLFGKPQTEKKLTVSVIPANSVLIDFEYQITACCAYYEGTGTYTQFPVKLEPGGRYMELFVTAPGQPEKSLVYIPGSEFLTGARNARWDGTYSRTSSPFPQSAKGIYTMRLQALTFRSMYRIGNCKPPNAAYPSLQIDASYTVLINGEQTPSLPAPYGSFKWSGQDGKPEYSQTIWTFNLS
jgi:hypothetical protein